VPWERLAPGPSGEYVEVIDHDPASGCLYAPVDLDDPRLLASDGLAPSEGNPQFHQQLAYAVAMRTVHSFEAAMGRPALWSPRLEGRREVGYVGKLRIYPHALRDQNAYYNPEKKALLFGYFRTDKKAALEGQFPGGMVFTCLSHDVVAHETTHALLDGMHRRFNVATNADQVAFHEAFADLVAMLQRFSMPDVLRHQIARTRGNLRMQNLLGELALEFGQALGLHGSLRSAIGRIDPVTQKWVSATPDPNAYKTTTEPHMRGAILVGAVFDAFLAIYELRSADLLRIASSGTGILPDGAIHPDLVKRLADEAAKVAAHVLRMCIRALDYCPPVDLTFGEYLRALITADFELAAHDARGYRVAFTEAFRRRGIYADGVRTMSADALRWRSAAEDGYEHLLKPVFEELAKVGDQLKYLGGDVKAEDVGLPGARDSMVPGRQSARELRYELLKTTRRRLHQRLKSFFRSTPGRTDLQYATGLDLRTGSESFEVYALNFAAKLDDDGKVHRQIILSLTQSADLVTNEGRDSSIPFEGGATIIADHDTAKVLYFIGKNVLSERRRARQTEFCCRARESGFGTYFRPELLNRAGLRFAMVHSSEGGDDHG
jgi:hypothetical protein